MSSSIVSSKLFPIKQRTCGAQAARQRPFPVVLEAFQAASGTDNFSCHSEALSNAQPCNLQQT